jgi:hypothetical protein
MDEASVMCGVMGGDCGKLGDAGKDVDVSFVNEEEDLKDSGGRSHKDRPRSLV